MTSSSFQASAREAWSPSGAAPAWTCMLDSSQTQLHASALFPVGVAALVWDIRLRRKAASRGRGACRPSGGPLGQVP
jgi:hypothetical protein